MRDTRKSLSAVLVLVFALVACWGVPAAAVAQLPTTIPLTMTLESPSELLFDVMVETVVVIPLSDSDSGSSTLSGTAEVSLDVDFSSGNLEVTGFSFTGGQIVVNSTLNLSFFAGLVDVTGSGLAGVPSTILPPSVLTPNASATVTGQFNAGDHDITINQGTITATGSVEASIDLSLDPISGASMSASPGTIDVSIFSIDEPANLTTYDFDLYLPIEFDSVYVDPNDANTVITTSVTGQVKAYEIDVILDFVPTNGIVGDVNQNGVVFGNGTGPAETDDVKAFVEGWLSTDLPLGLNGYKKGDLNFDRKTDLADAFILHQVLAQQGGAFNFSLLSGVPEPSTALLCLIGAAMLCGRRRR